MSSWKQVELASIQALYGKWHTKYAEVVKTVYDDRTVFVNLYRMMVQAVESLPEEPDNYVCVAIDKQLDEDRKILQSIIRTFESYEDPNWKAPEWFN